MLKKTHLTTHTLTRKSIHTLVTHTHTNTHTLSLHLVFLAGCREQSSDKSRKTKKKVFNWQYSKQKTKKRSEAIMYHHTSLRPATDVKSFILFNILYRLSLNILHLQMKYCTQLHNENKLFFVHSSVARYGGLYAHHQSIAFEHRKHLCMYVHACSTMHNIICMYICTKTNCEVYLKINLSQKFEIPTGK